MLNGRGGLSRVLEPHRIDKKPSNTRRRPGHRTNSTGRELVALQDLGAAVVTRSTSGAMRKMTEKPLFFGHFRLISARIVGYTYETAGALSAFHSGVRNRGNRDI